jgi:hypothetical protein
MVDNPFGSIDFDGSTVANSATALPVVGAFIPAGGGRQA